MRERIESLRRAVRYGLANGKTNLIVDLDVLAAILHMSTPLYCEHGIAEGDWCEDCHQDMLQARIEAGNA
jgi:hypothetical protein